MHAAGGVAASSRGQTGLQSDKVTVVGRKDDAGLTLRSRVSILQRNPPNWMSRGDPPRSGRLSMAGDGAHHRKPSRGMSRPAGAPLPRDVAIPGDQARERLGVYMLVRSGSQLHGGRLSLANGGRKSKPKPRWKSSENYLFTALGGCWAGGWGPCQREGPPLASPTPRLRQLKPAESFLWKTNGSTEGKGKSQKSGLGWRSAEPAQPRPGGAGAAAFANGAGPVNPQLPASARLASTVQASQSQCSSMEKGFGVTPSTPMASPGHPQLSGRQHRLRSGIAERGLEVTQAASSTPKLTHIVDKKTHDFSNTLGQFKAFFCQVHCSAQSPCTSLSPSSPSCHLSLFGNVIPSVFPLPLHFFFPLAEIVISGR